VHGPLALIPKFITGWALAGSLTLLYLAGGFRFAHIPVYLVALALAVGARGMAESSVSAWRLTLGLIGAIGLSSTVFLFVYAAAREAGHELYLNSPATFLVVLINSLFTVVPALVVAFLCWRARPFVGPLISGRPAGAT
jgi:hypothetical protein